MIIEFKVTNFRSISDAQTLSMVASPDKGLPQNISASDFDADLSLLRSAVIYGPNAAGKSNLIRAMQLMQWLILTSAKESQAGEKIAAQPFLFDEQAQTQPTEFELSFSKNGVRYQYGFVFNRDRILEEWLFAYPAGRVQRWFVRQYNELGNKYEWEFSKLFKGAKQQIVDLTRPEVLFLSNAVKLNNEQLLAPFKWFQEDLVVITPANINHVDLNKSIDQIKSPEGKKKIMQYLNVADPTITDISLENEIFSEDKLPRNLPVEFKDMVSKNMLGRDFVRIKFHHAANISLDVGDESEGTRKFLGFSGQWVDALEHGKVVLVDELDNSLHSLAVRFLISMIYNSETNKKNTQLIFSTHDTSLLDTELFRRDQVWFVEKDKKNSTQLYPLLDFSPRKNEAIGKGYLQGRYGALPYVGDWRF